MCTGSVPDSNRVGSTLKSGNSSSGLGQQQLESSATSQGVSNPGQFKPEFAESGKARLLSPVAPGPENHDATVVIFS
eukprot:3934961-Rhodomonas_salina.1